MSYIEELIKKYCPNGVEYKSLGEVCIIQAGGTPLKTKIEYWQNGNIRWLASGVCKNKKIVDEITGYITEEGLKNSSAKLMKKDTTLIALVGAGKMGKVAFLTFEAAINQNIAGIYPIDKMKLDTSFLFYISQTLYNKFQSIGRSQLSMANLSFVKSLEIPLPPIEIQKEIVRILDSFTNYSTLLNKELELRKKQYEYYRDELLNFENNSNVEWKTLGEIAEIGTGSSNTNENIENGNYPFFIRSQNVLKKNEYEFDEIAIITSGDGVGVGKIFHYIEGKYALHQRAYRIHITDNLVIPKYYFYYMKNNFSKYIEKNACNSSVTSIRRPMLNNFKVPIPPLEEQERIVNILDKFDYLCNSITKGIPREIELRKKQYEYYREKLLKFE